MVQNAHKISPGDPFQGHFVGFFAVGLGGGMFPDAAIWARPKPSTPRHPGVLLKDPGVLLKDPGVPGVFRSPTSGCVRKHTPPQAHIEKPHEMVLEWVSGADFVCVLHRFLR